MQMKPIGSAIESILIKMGLPAKPKPGQYLLEEDVKRRARARKHLKRLARRNAQKEDRKNARSGMKPAGHRSD